MNPERTVEYCRQVINRFPELSFDFHAHNDYGLAIANSLAAIKAGIKGIHTTVNGLGERAGNAELSATVVNIHDQLGMKTAVNEKKLYEISSLVERFSGERVPANLPIVGGNVFTQVSGVHADGDNKGNLYCNDLLPERFGRTRKYALGKTSRESQYQKNLEYLGIQLDKDSLRKVSDKITELGDKKNNITLEDLPYIVSEVLGDRIMSEKVKLDNYYIANAQGLRPMANLSILYRRGKI